MDASDWSKFGLTVGVAGALVVLAVAAAHMPGLQSIFMQVSGSLLGLLGIHHGHDALTQHLGRDEDEDEPQPGADTLTVPPVVLTTPAPNVDDRLEPAAEQAKQVLLKACPDAVITSGRRTIPDQARAMAENCRIKRSWIRKTYKATVVSDACQAAVDKCTSPDQYEAAILEQLQHWPLQELRHLSWHLTGEAFDVKPVGGVRGAAIVTKLKAIADAHVRAGGQAKFLSTEAGLVRWHLQIA